LNNAPLNYAKRAQYAGVAADEFNNALGSVAAVVWLEAGELITIAAVSSVGKWRDPTYSAVSGFVRQNCIFDLQITPFRNDSAWLQVNSAGNGTGAMDWDDAPNFSEDTIDLVGFLNAEMKTDDFIDNFCKTFNLALTQPNAQTFSLDVKQNKIAVNSLPVELDFYASVADRENTPVGLPSEYDVGFTIDTEEEGYAETNETGGGIYFTGATEINIVAQTSTFSYNWFKTLTKVELGGDISISVPIISKAEVWDAAMPYLEAMSKRYVDQAYRFWYADGFLSGTYRFNGALISLGAVKDTLPGLITLNYKNVPKTILSEYFTLLIDGASHYTNIKAFLSPRMYAELDGSRFVRFNGDIYFSAELSGYDPHGRNQTIIKLIRKI
jgi:hypothetical protein